MNSRFLNSNEIKKFTMILDAYQPSGQVIFDFANSKFGVIAGPTGAGKDTIRHQLLKVHPEVYRPVLSTTTRPPRDGEQDGVEYHFRDLKLIEEALDEHRLLQAELIHNQQISGLDFMDIKSLDPTHYGLSILVVQAEKKLRKLNSDLKTVFLIPPSLEELMRRIHESRSMKQDEITRRIEAAKVEITLSINDENYYHLVNENIEATTKLADNYFSRGAKDTDADNYAKQTLSKILNELSNA